MMRVVKVATFHGVWKNLERNQDKKGLYFAVSEVSWIIFCFVSVARFYELKCFGQAPDSTI